MPAVQETSIKRLVVGPLDVRLHSSAVHRILKMVTCAMDHEYEPYCKPQQGQTSHANSCSIYCTGLTLTANSQLTANSSLHWLHPLNFTLVSTLSLIFSSLVSYSSHLSSPLFSSLLVYSILPMIRNCNSLHFTVSSSHCYFLAQPIFQHTAVHESSDLLDHMREDKPNTFVSDRPCTAIDELIPGML